MSSSEEFELIKQTCYSRDMDELKRVLTLEIANNNRIGTCIIFCGWLDGLKYYLSLKPQLPKQPLSICLFGASSNMFERFFLLLESDASLDETYMNFSLLDVCINFNHTYKQIEIAKYLIDRGRITCYLNWCLNLLSFRC